MNKTHNNSNKIHFLLNGKSISVDGVNPTQSLLYYLREAQRLIGTKEGCAEGDCGACTVVVAELIRSNADEKSGYQVDLKTVNACIQFVPTLDGKAVFTVEYLRQQISQQIDQKDKALHPVQQAMVDQHGSQCGFCTPGFIMSLWNVYNQHLSQGTKASQEEVRSALTGNLCRCTGYRPILAAGQQMFELPDVKFDVDDLRKKLEEIQRPESLSYESQGIQYFAPKDMDVLTDLRAEHPEATILAGGTDVGLWVNKQFRDINPIIYIGEVDELKQISITDEKIKIGAGVSLTDTYSVLSKYYPEMDQMWERFASMPIRNVGTLGGNVANGSPIGDSMPALIALDAKVTLRSSKNGSRTLLLQDLYLDYMKKDLAADEVLELIELPLPSDESVFRCYKLSKRHDSDISVVFAAFALRLKGETVEHCRIAYGGMAATPKRASHSEQSLIGLPWTEESVKVAMKVLQQDYAPMSDARASDRNRTLSAGNLLYRFYLETRLENPLASEDLSVFAHG